jgi:uncharacterized protein YndB with AHSA1/START domain
MESNKKESVTTQIHQIYIRATPEAIWSAITTPEWTSQYGNRARAMCVSVEVQRTDARYGIAGGNYRRRSS